MTTDINGDTVSRTLKQLVDSGRASTFEEALELLGGYRLQLHIGTEQARTLHGQIVALTTVELARRVFLGGVYVSVELDAPAHSCIASGGTLVEALMKAGARVGSPGQLPSISIGGSGARDADFHVRLVVKGWRAGIAPADDSIDEAAGYVMPLAAVAAAAMAVCEAFFFVSTDSPLAGKRRFGISLWEPGSSTWETSEADGPPLRYLPSDVWILGVGHLGQAYSWCLGMLPYGNVQTPKARVVIQDTDVVTKSTESTSLLSTQADLKRMKTRVVSEWLEARGFRTDIIERLFDGAMHRREGDPGVLLCGVDNPAARRVLDTVGFSLIVEAGLGSRFDDFQCARIHSLPGSRSAVEIWQLQANFVKKTPGPAYEALLNDGLLDQCGVTLLAGKAVGAAFVGTFAATLVISELLRLLHGGVAHDVIDVDLFDLDYRRVVLNPTDFTGVNTGFLTAVE